MGWANINLSDAYEREQDVLSGYNCDQLLLELHCNFRKEDITKEKVLKHIKEVLDFRVNEALQVFNDNLDSLVKQAIKDK